MERRSLLKGLLVAAVVPFKAAEGIAVQSDYQARLAEACAHINLLGSYHWSERVRLYERMEDAWGDLWGLAIRISDAEGKPIYKHAVSILHPSYLEEVDFKRLAHRATRALLERAMVERPDQRRWLI